MTSTQSARKHAHSYSWQAKTNALIQALQGRSLQAICDTLTIENSHLRAWLGEWRELCGFNLSYFKLHYRNTSFFAKDTDLVYRYVDRRAAQFYEYTDDEILHKNDKQLRWKNDTADLYQNSDLLCMSNKVAEYFELPYLTLDGKCLFIKAIKLPIFDEQGDVTGMIGGASHRVLKRLTFERLLQLRPNMVCQLINSNTDKEAYFIYHSFGWVSVSQIEALSLLFYIQGYPIKLISKFVSRSVKTIDNYIARVKVLLDCRHKHELMEKLICGNFLDNFSDQSYIMTNPLS